jgi:glycosyltransferase involved in cell wall biosynthesis
MIKVFAIYPAFDCSINEMAVVWAKLCESNDSTCTVVTNIKDTLKANVSVSSRETLKNLEIHRFVSPLSSEKVLKQIIAIASNLRPDVIFCAVDQNLPIARAVQRVFPAPICLHTEYFLDNSYGLRRRSYLGVKWFRPIVHYWYRLNILSQCESVLCSNPEEFFNLNKDNFTNKLWYLPWPIINTNLNGTYEDRKLNQIVYIGSLSKAKGVTNLVNYLLALLYEFPEFEIIIVGPKIDRTASIAITNLQQEGKDRVKLFNRCSKEEALDLISSSFCVISPGKRLGWGIIGDAWVTSTPIITVGLHYDLVDGKNCILAKDIRTFLFLFNKLLNDKQLWTKLSEGGKASAELHHIDVVASSLLDCLINTLQLPQDRL